jgi:hypothetical protein
VRGVTAAEVVAMAAGVEAAEGALKTLFCYLEAVFDSIRRIHCLRCY